MRRLTILIFAVFSHAALGQSAQNSNLKEQLIEITATGSTTYDNGIATAHENVAIHVGETDIYSDHATYNSATHVVHLEGKCASIAELRSIPAIAALSHGDESDRRRSDPHDQYSLFLEGRHCHRHVAEGKLVQNGIFATHDSSNPDFRLRARRVRAHEGDRVIMRDLTSTLAEFRSTGLTSISHSMTISASSSHQPI